MWKLCCGVLFFAALVYCKSIRNSELQLNPQSVLYDDVYAVKHNATSRRVLINLTEKRRCLQPMFMVRLSGTSLYLLDKVHHNETVPVVVFSYPPLVDIGTYFLEVLIMYCETFNPNAFNSMCLVDPTNGKNVLTLPYKFEIKSPEDSSHSRPRWILHQNATPAFLPTRYQHMCGDTFCKSNESEIAQHNEYEWSGHESHEHVVKKAFQWGLSNLTSHTGNESITICMVGASHAGQMYLHSLKMDLPSYVHFEWVQSRYPQLFDINSLVNCTYAVVGYGQWQLSSWMQGKPYNAETHERHMRHVLHTIKAANIPTQVFMRSMNLNGLGYMYTNCPASDFRHPPIVMLYNSIVARLSSEYGVPYIDMFHLQGPMWDISLDWSHPLGRVFNAEVMHVLHHTTSYSIAHQRKPVLEANHYLRQPVEYHFLVRFSDSEVVYLAVNGVFRAIPSAESLFHMGYVNSKITELDAKLKPLELIGPPLPEI